MTPLSQTPQTHQETPVSHRTLRRGASVLAATFVLATCGYVLAGWTWVEAIYMVTITIFGVGYGEVHPLESSTLKLFTIGVIVTGCSSVIYVLGGLVQMIAEGEVQRLLGGRQREKSMNELHDHTIICGFGRVGKMLAAELTAEGQSLVIVDVDASRAERARELGYLAVAGDATDDHTLHRLGLLRARTLATVLPNDAMNVFITLTARDLSESVTIIARAECPTTERKLLRGGATHVVMPAAISAIRISQLVTASPHEHESDLPEARFRMLAERDRTRPIEAEVREEIEELAELASDLTHQLAEHD